MGAQRLSDKSARRLGRITGLGESLIRAWAHGGYVHDFVTDDHRHGWVDIKIGVWDWDDDPVHYSSCETLFPAARPGG